MPSDRPSLLVRRPEAVRAHQQHSSVAEQLAIEPQMRQGRAVGNLLNVPNVEALTDEVIRQIDRRVLAQRERLGRV